jgi:integrase
VGSSPALLVGRSSFLAAALLTNSTSSRRTRCTHWPTRLATGTEALIYLAAYGGLRAGELEALQVSRLNVLAGTVGVVESLSEVSGRLIVGPTETGRRRVVPFPRFLCECRRRSNTEQVTPVENCAIHQVV